jgi:5'(3')-deoxyribonucleotidase
VTGPRQYILGVDLDGVCGDYTSAFREVVARERGIDPSTLGDQRSWDFVEWGIEPDDFNELHRVAVLEHHMFRTMPVVDGAAEALWRLSDAGVWIRLITHRLYVNWGHAVVLEDTAAWLDTAGIPYRDICFLGQKPQVEADAYLDDAPHNIVALQEQGNIAIVFDQPYNQGIDGPRARGWVEVEQIVRELLASRGFPIQEQFPGLDHGARRLHDRLGSRPPADGLDEASHF